MKIEDIEVVLMNAAQITNHRNFVIVGSLSGIGSLINPPREMAMSRDIDLYTKMDPDRIFVDVPNSLGERSEFSRQNGFFADPVSPKIIAAPRGWEERLCPISLSGGLVAWFMDANDAACAKLIRGWKNDLEWVKAGLEAGAISKVIIEERLPRCENTLEGETEEAAKRLGRLFESYGDKNTP